MLMKKTLRILFFSLSIFGFLNAQTLNYYYGNLHSHSGYSDGNKDASSTGVSLPSGDYNFAKASLHFNFLGISEHNHFTSTGNPGMKRPNYSLGLAQAASANQDNVFLCLYGMEWGTISNGGHVIIYGFNQLIGWENTVVGVTGPNYDIYNAVTDYNGLFKLVRNNPNSFCYLAHPQWNDYSSLTTSGYNLMWDSAIVGVPLRSGPAFSTDTTYTDYPAGNYVQYYRKMLSKGYHVGMTYDHDNHYLTFGRNNAGRLVIITPTLTQNNLYAAMKDMHFYGSDDWNAKLDFRIGTKIMGDSTSGLTPPTINFIHNDDDGELADSIKLWSGVEGSNTYSSLLAGVKFNNTLSFTDNAMAPGTNKYYYVEVIQADGDRIISSPIWYRLSQFASVNEYEKSFSFVAFPNPVNSVLYLSTDLKETYQVNITDVAGKLVYNENYFTPDAKISTSNFEKGIYMLVIKCNNYSKVQKLVIE